MASKPQVRPDGSVITPEGALSFPALFEPRPPMAGNADQTPKFSTGIVFYAGTDISVLEEAALRVATERWGTKAKAVLKGARNPHIRTDTEGKGYPEGSVFLNARSKNRPGLVAIFKDPETGKPAVITDPSKVYPGVIAQAFLKPFAYDQAGNRGIGWGLNGIQIVRDGDRLDNFVPAADVFDADPNAKADLSDLEEADDLSDLR